MKRYAIKTGSSIDVFIIETYLPSFSLVILKEIWYHPQSTLIMTGQKITAIKVATRKLILEYIFKQT